MGTYNCDDTVNRELIVLLMLRFSVEEVGTPILHLIINKHRNADIATIL